MPLQSLYIEQAQPGDLPAIQAIFARARTFMKRNGNPSQWKDNRPDPALIEQDIQSGAMYVWKRDDHICGVFSLLFGLDPTYGRIENGSWLNEAPYAAIHRVASDGSCPGLFDALMRFCVPQCASMQIDNLRMDTHQDNRIMQHLLQKHGFEFCGTIYTDDGTPRMAFQKVLSAPHCIRGDYRILSRHRAGSSRPTHS